LALIAALWYLLIAPAGGAPPKATATPVRSATPWPTVTVMVVTAPTQSPAPAATATVANPTEIAVGARVQVTGTGGSKLRIRQNPGTDTVVVKLVPDGSLFVVVGGPQESGGYTWWKVDDQAGTVGWAASTYLKLAP